jgi:hypothetical protein
MKLIQLTKFIKFATKKPIYTTKRFYSNTLEESEEDRWIRNKEYNNIKQKIQEEPKKKSKITIVGSSDDEEKAPKQNNQKEVETLKNELKDLEKKMNSIKKKLKEMENK